MSHLNLQSPHLQLYYPNHLVKLEDQVLPLHMFRWLPPIFDIGRSIHVDDLDPTYPTTNNEKTMLFNAIGA
jgi:hypothetical protein